MGLNHINCHHYVFSMHNIVPEISHIDWNNSVSINQRNVRTHNYQTICWASWAYIRTREWGNSLYWQGHHTGRWRLQENKTKLQISLYTKEHVVNMCWSCVYRRMFQKDHVTDYISIPIRDQRLNRLDKHTLR